MSKLEWSIFNNLLALLHQLKVVERVKEQFAGYGNTAPSELLQSAIDAAQEVLDKS